jgi:hypothetical protein
VDPPILKTLFSGDLEMRPDFYHRRLNAISTKDLTFTKGTSGGAWLRQSKIVSLTSSYIGKTTNTNASPTYNDYLTLYGPILHEDAHQLARLTEMATTADEYMRCR